MAITDICNLIQRLIQRGFAGPYLRAIASNVYFSRRHEYLWGTTPNDKTACDNKPTRIPLVMSSFIHSLTSMMTYSLLLMFVV